MTPVVTAAHCEAKLHGFRKTQDGIVVSFVLHPQEAPSCFALDPLGTRYMLAVAQIGDDEQPVTGSSRESAASLPGRHSPAPSPVAPEGDENRGNSLPASPTTAERPAAEAGQLSPTSGRQGDPSKSERARIAYANATPGEKAVTRAVLLCKTTTFQRWQGRNVHPSYRTEEHAAQFIRYHCGIASRAGLATDPGALARFLKLETQYLADTNQIAEVR